MIGIKEKSMHYNDFSVFSQKLRVRIIQLRKRKGLTQEDMQSFELSLRQYQRIEHGTTTNITITHLFKISKALGVSMHELLFF